MLTTYGCLLTATRELIMIRMFRHSAMASYHSKECLATKESAEALRRRIQSSAAQQIDIGQITNGKGAMSRRNKPARDPELLILGTGWQKRIARPKQDTKDLCSIVKKLDN